MQRIPVIDDQLPPPHGDEMLDHAGRVRPAWQGLHRALEEMGLAELRDRAEVLARSYLDEGVTFDFAGEEQPFPVDPVPRIIDGQEWARVSVGIAQRVRALEALLDDVHTARRVVDDGVLPAALVARAGPVLTAMRGYRPPNGVRIHVAGIDLFRDDDGRLRVLEDNVRTPSGVSYVLSNRRAMANTLPELFPPSGVRRVAEYPSRLLRALEAAAPEGTTDPTVVVLTPGRWNSAYFEHALLARTMGVELVEATDLVVRGRRLHMRTTVGLQRVDVVYRRTDDAFLDPTVFRPDSLLGVPGLVDAVRAGTVVLANSIGNGIADSKLTYTWVPDLIRYYLGEEPLLPQVPTWRLGEASAREEVLDRLAELVVKPVEGSGGKGVLIGPDASPQQLEAARERILTAPHAWIAQPTMHLGTIPTLTPQGLRPRHADVRPFALNDGEDVWVLPGGLTRVALAEGERIVNSSRGGGSKDTWVLSTAGTPQVRVPRITGEVRVIEAAVDDAPVRRAPGRPEPRPVTAAIPIIPAEWHGGVGHGGEGADACPSRETADPGLADTDSAQQQEEGPRC